jgi:hypothetical protein
MGQAKQREPERNKRVADAVARRIAEEERRQEVHVAQVKLKMQHEAEDRERLAALPPEQQRQVYNRRGKSAVNATLMIGLALGAMTSFKYRCTTLNRHR